MKQTRVSFGLPRHAHDRLLALHTRMDLRENDICRKIVLAWLSRHNPKRVCLKPECETTEDYTERMRALIDAEDHWL
jgi:hypothetical protein